MIFIIYFIMIVLGIFFSSIRFLNTVDFAFIFVFLVNFYYQPIPSLLFSFFTGIYVDFYYSFPLGLYSMIYLSLSYVMNILKSNIDFDFIFSRFFNFVVFNILTKILAFVGTNIAGWKINFQWYYLLYPFISFIFFEIIRKFFINLRFLKHKNYGCG